MRTRTILLLAASLLTVACGATPDGSSEAAEHHEIDKTGAKGKGDAWDFANDPARVSNESFEYNIDKLPKQGQMDHLPIPGDYWATYKDSINHNWESPSDGDESKSPSAKYARAFGLDPVAFRKAISEKYGLLQPGFTKCKAGSGTAGCSDETDKSSYCATIPEDLRTSEDEGKGGVCIPSWWGICHGWSPYAITEKLAVHSVNYNGETFYPGDLNALLSLAYTKVDTDFISRRCNASAAAGGIEYDDDGRAINSACRDMNPGSLYVIAANMLGIKHKGFVVDRTWDSQVWNQPVRGFKITKLEEVDAFTAQKLVSGDESFKQLIKDKDLAVDEFVTGSFKATKTGTITVFMSGLSSDTWGDYDSDLRVAVGKKASYEFYTCKSINDGSNESCKVKVKKGQKVYWMASNDSGDKVDRVSVWVGSKNGYKYDNHAERFFNVTMDLNWVTEGYPRHEISNPDGFVDHQTKTDTYTFVLECDKDGNIIGGEYTGGSKKFHSDFLWIPKGTPQNLRVGQFTIDYEKLHMLNEQAAQ